MASAIGMAVGAMILCIAALLGLHALLNQFPAAFLGLKVFGGLYLLWLAFQTWRGAASPLRVEAAADDRRMGFFRHFWLAAATMLSNPKAAVQYGVIFAAVLPREPSTSVVALLPPVVFMLEASCTWSWHSCCRPRVHEAPTFEPSLRSTGRSASFLAFWAFAFYSWSDDRRQRACSDPSQLRISA